MKRFCILLVAIAVFGAMMLPSYVSADKRVSDAQPQNRPDAAPDEYFVAFRDALTENDKANVRATGARVNGKFPEVRAVAVKVRNEQQLAALQRNPRVDGRKLRRYKRRWRVERLFAWLHKFRRVVVRYDYHAENFLGFVHLDCIKILLRCYL
jgi:hypothetical protein